MAENQLLIGNGHGGARPNSGPKPSWFKEEMADLLKKCSPKIAEFVTKVFDGEMIDPRVTKLGVVYVEASVHDKTVLLATLAKLSGFLDDGDSPLRAPLQAVIDQVQAIKLMQELNYGVKPGGNGNGAAPIVGNGHTETPPDSSAASTL